MFQRHTSEVMFEMVFNFLTILCPNWKICLLGLSSDGTQNMIKCVVGVVIQFHDFMHDDCSLFCIWYGVHQLDLAMEHIMNEVVKERLFSVMISFITHLIRQQKLIVDIGTTCPRIVNRWLFTYKVTKRFKIHRPKLFVHIEFETTNFCPALILVGLFACDG